MNTLVPPSQAPARVQTRIPYLDALRCLAILLVITLHAMGPFLVSPSLCGRPGWYLCILQNPINRAGVPLFFMISGFLLLRDPATGRTASFYRHRIPRLLVPLSVWNLIYFLAYHPPGEPFRLVDYLRPLLNFGASYHMWFVYAILGMYLLAPVLRLVVEKGPRFYPLILMGVAVFPSAILPLLNSILPFEIRLFTPMLEGLLGYFLLGYLLGTAVFPPSTRAAIYCGGAAGYLMDVWADLATSSTQAIPLPSQSGYRLSHYLVAAAIFVLFRAFWEKHAALLTPVECLLSRLSQCVFGVFWVHILALDLAAQLIGDGWTIAPFLVLKISIATLLSFLLMVAVSRIPILRKLLI